MSVQLTKDSFWETDLSDIEATFLLKGSKITDCKIYLDEIDPEQGSVLLDKVVHIDKIIKKPTFFQNILYSFFKK
jgi:hypothetical protein